MVGTKSVRFSESESSSETESAAASEARLSPDLKPSRSILVETQSLPPEPDGSHTGVLKEQEPDRKTEQVLVTQHNLDDTKLTSDIINKKKGQENIAKQQTSDKDITKNKSGQTVDFLVESNKQPCEVPNGTKQPLTSGKTVPRQSFISNLQKQIWHTDQRTGQKFTVAQPRSTCNPVSVRIYKVHKTGKPKSAPQLTTGKELAEFCQSRCSNNSVADNLEEETVRTIQNQDTCCLHSEENKFSGLDSQPLVKYRKFCWTESLENKTQDNCTSDLDVESNTQNIPSGEISSALGEHNKEVNMETKTYYYKSSSSGDRTGNISLMMDNQEFQDLERRLSVHLQKVQQIRQTPDLITSTGFLESISILETEITNMKKLYEAELYKARRVADDRSREKAHLGLEVEKLKNQLMDTNERLTGECERNRELINQITAVHQTLAEREAELRQVRASMNGPLGDLDRLQRDHENVSRESSTVKKRYEKEVALRQEADDKIQQLEQKLQFEQKVHSEDDIKETTDLNDRLTTASNTILSLEEKIREITDSEKSLQVMIQEVRDAAEAEIRHYQEESVQEYNRHISSLKMQIDEDTRKMDSMQSENVDLHAQIEELIKRIRSLEGQIASLEHQKTCVEDILSSERQQAREHIGHLEQKLRELQDTLFMKMREINASRDAQISMKAEVEAFRTLLEDEERRLQLARPVTLTSNLGPSMPGTTGALQSTKASSAAYSRQEGGSGGPVFLPPPVEPFEPPSYASQLVGPVRAKSAPVSRSKAHLVPTSLGQGKDYFESMFKDLKRTNIGNIPKLPSPPPEPTQAFGAQSTQYMSDVVETPRERPASVKTHDFNTYTSSAVGQLQILEVQQEGKFVRLLNASEKDQEIGGYMLEQMVGGHPVAVFRFPPRTRFDANSTVTVWAGSNDNILHQPPRDFVWKEQQKWGTGPECTTILCKPNGQAIAWMTAAHRFSKDAYGHDSSVPETLEYAWMQLNGDREVAEKEELTELDMNINASKPEPVYLRRERASPPSLAPQKHPHGASPPSPTHPSTGQARPLTYGNDNSSVNRQTRIQSTRPDPVPGAPYAGASAQRMGSALLMRYSPTVKGSGALANKAGGNMTYGQPSPFTSPLQQDYARAYDSRTTSLVKY